MVPLQAGMVITNEPGYYEEGNFGVRTENVYVISHCNNARNSLGEEFADEKARSDSHAGNFLKFEPFTRSPIQTKLVLPELLSVEQRKWINEYNAKCEAHASVLRCCVTLFLLLHTAAEQLCIYSALLT